MNPVKVLTISKASVTALIAAEICSKEYYIKFCSHPLVPGLGSGITIGIGYDLGYNSAAQIVLDWKGYVADDELTKLVLVAGLKGHEAVAALPHVKEISIPFQSASEVFMLDTLPRYASEAVKTYPGLELLKPDAAGGVVMLTYNRGTALTDSPSDKSQRRREMAALKPLIAKQDYNGIAEQMLLMMRLWDGKANYPGAQEKRAEGLLNRCKTQSALVKNSLHQYAESELIQIPLN